MATVEHEPVREVVQVTTADVLNRAADLLEEFGHCKFWPAKDEDGLYVLPTEHRAVTFCLTGAIERALFDLSGWRWRENRDDKTCAGYRLLRGCAEAVWATGVPRNNEPQWNNEPGRTKAEVVAKLRDAARNV